MLILSRIHAFSVVLATAIVLVCAGCLSANAQPAKPDRNASVIRPAAAQSAGKRVALVVGNGNYTALNTLGDNPRNDADDMARALEGFGFKVTRLKDSNRRDMNAALEAFGRDASGSEAALFYFAGHGMQIRGDNYLMPVNATAESEAAVKDEGVSLSRVLDELEGSAAVKIVLIDACRDNPITGKFRTAARGLAVPSSPPSGTVIAFAAEPGKTAANGNGRNGIFTAGLLKALKGKDLSLDSVLTVASEEVESQSNRKQTPYVNGPKTLQKNFHFRVTITPSPQMMDSEYWASVKDSKDAADFEAYLTDYPQGQFRRLAENRVKSLRVVAASVAALMPIASPEPQVVPVAPPVVVTAPSQQTIEGKTKSTEDVEFDGRKSKMETDHQCNISAMHEMKVGYSYTPRIEYSNKQEFIHNIAGMDVVIDERFSGDLNRSSGPEFEFSNEILTTNYEVLPKSKVNAVRAKLPYLVYDTPNLPMGPLVIVYRFLVQGQNSDLTWSRPPVSHNSCVFYKIIQ